MGTAIGVDIGGTKIAAAVVDEGGAVGPLRTVPTPAAQGPAAVLAAAAEVARRVACGVGTAGAVDLGGRITHTTATLPGWLGTDVRGALAGALGLPVTVHNDVQAMAVGEAWCGAAASVPSALVVGVGTGIGGALIIDGVLVAGRHGLAGSVGHLPASRATGRPCGCGGHDHVEAYAAGPAIAADYAARAGHTAVPPLETVSAAARDGDPAALAAISEAAHVLGAGLAAAVNLLDPDLVVLGGGVVALGARFLDEVAASLRAAALPGPNQVALRPAQLGPAAVLVGAARAALLTQRAGRS